jgi:dienelactone hydrolase
MLRRTKEDWKDFAERLAKEGFAVLAIDLRGHGESTKRNGKTIRVKEFKRGKDFLDIKKDVKAAKEFLKRKKLDTKDLILIGASIGANIALNYAIEDKDVKKLVLLSPGRDYSGVKTLKAMKEYDGKLFICASKDDPYSFSSVKELYRIATCKKKMVLYKNAGHGTRMFGKEKQKPGELGELLLEWLKK